MPEAATPSISDQTHTAGPWYKDGRCTNASLIASESAPSGNTVALIYDRPDEHKANAQLVAAAPDLLAACKAIIDGEDMAIATKMCSEAYYMATDIEE